MFNSGDNNMVPMLLIFMMFSGGGMGQGDDSFMIMLILIMIMSGSGGISMCENK